MSLFVRIRTGLRNSFFRFYSLVVFRFNMFQKYLRGNKGFAKAIPQEKDIELLLKRKALRILKQVLPENKPEKIKLEQLNAAMTNEVYVVTVFPTEEKYLLRLYGKGAELFFQRQQEVETFQNLAKVGFGPKLIGTFEGGRVEEYIVSDNLNTELIRDEKVSQEIAQIIYQLHSMFPKGSEENCETWTTLYQWLEKAAEAVEKLTEDKQLPENLSLDLIEKEIGELKNFFDNQTNPLPIVFCHNDAQYGNILRKRSTESLMLIDYEYAGYSYRGFDLGNHFCEWAADYDTSEPHKLDFGRYPTKEEQFNFFRSYLITQYKAEKISKTPQEMEQEMEKLYIETNQCSLLSHLKWSLWGIVQAANSKIDFDYLDYAQQRMSEYFKRKDEFLTL